jgi:phosphate transport system protein
MERHFDEELSDLKKNILKMASLVDDAIGKAVKSLVDRDEELAGVVENDDDYIDALELEIDRFCLELLARRQPIATDLRFITSVMKINNDLERIGDHAANIAHKARILAQYPKLKPLVYIPKMGEIAKDMLKDAINALVNKDSELARKMVLKDEDVDKLYVQIYRDAIDSMMEDREKIKSGTELIMIAKHFERMADYITNLAEDIVYMVEGKTIKHGFEQ